MDLRHALVIMRAAVAVLVAVVLAACSGGGSPSPSAAGGSASASASAPSSPSVAASASGGSAGPRTSLTVGLGYIPSVQFAPFYLAQQKGYYRDAGLDVTFQNKIDPDLVTLVGQGSIDIGLADGTSVIPAASQGIPIRYIATVYRGFPSIVFAKASSGIKSAADLKGRKIGIPGRYGSSWIMLQALLKSAKLSPNDVQIVEYPDFGQGAAVQQGAVDAATGFVNNEPVQLEANGVPVTVLTVDEIVPLPGPGLIAAAKTIESKRAAVQGFVAATIRAMKEIATSPSVGLDAAIAAVPELAQNKPLQQKILEATVAAWTRGGTPADIGAIDKGGWTKSIEFMTTLGLVANPVTTDQLVDDSLLPKSKY
jgi:NitT/TauT family transport system substrate-binding protein